MSKGWLSLLFETSERGVSSAYAPELLPDNQTAWMLNGQNRGGKPSSRPNFAFRLNLPPGLVQGCEYFGVQNGMLVASIAGRLYRLRTIGNSFECAEIPLSFVNSPIIKQVWMRQTVETLVVQDGQSDAIFYDGSTATRSVTGQVPRGRQMDYGNGRLWVAVNANEVVAGDIRTGTPGSELFFTEATYLTGGGKLFFPKDMTGMSFIPVTGQSDYGALLVFGAGETNAIRADITSRDDWGKIPGFVTGILRSVGAASQWSIVSVNQDLFWRDSNGGIRSIRNALADEAGPGSSPLSREVARLTDFDSQSLLPFCSGVYFDNRLLMTSSPYLLPNGGVGWKGIIALDFAPLSSIEGKSQASYDGQWSGLQFVKLVGGDFHGKNRAFAIATDQFGNNQLWEFGTGARADIIPAGCTDGTASIDENRIVSYVEYPLRDFGQSKARKRLERCDVWLSSINGDLDLQVYWRADNSQKWISWDQAETCAQTSDPSTTEPHVWKNLRPQERPQFKTFTIPQRINEVIKYAAHVGFEFQIRLKWTGRARIHRVMLHATQLPDPNYADRTGFQPACIENDITGNQIVYNIPTEGGCPVVVISYDGRESGGGEAPFSVEPGGRYCFGSASAQTYNFSITNNGPTNLYVGLVSILGCDSFEVTTQPSASISPGDSSAFQISYTPGEPCEEGALIRVGEGIFQFVMTGTLQVNITSNPSDQMIPTGGSASFTVGSSGQPPLTYQWQVSEDNGLSWGDIVNGENYSGVQTGALGVINVPEEFDGNQYRCIVSGCNVVVSDEATLTVGVLNGRVLIVGGGGGGGYRFGGGGGGGGVIEQDVILGLEITYPVVIGSGGAGALAPLYQGMNGGDTTFNALIASGGGGGGGGGDLGIPSQAPGATGGCGGGGGGGAPFGAIGAGATGGSGTNGGDGGSGYFAGGDSVASGGGGGADGNGQSSVNGINGGNGGPGVLSSVPVVPASFAGGGGGSAHNTGSGGTPGSGGSGGGGNGGAGGSAGVNGLGSTGGGGGGSDAIVGLAPGGNGGSGIFVIRYSGAQRYTGGTVQFAGGDVIHTFTVSGSLVPL